MITYAERLPGGGFRINFTPASDEVADPNVEVAAAAMNRDVERHVRALPEQYLWSYKRFRIHPPGGDNPYRRDSREVER